MKKAICLLAGLLALGGCGGGNERPADDTGPWIQADREEHDFGDMFVDQSSSCAFTFTNRGKETLRIRDVKHECGCTVPEFSRREIPPGETAEMTVEFKPPFIGVIAKRIRVYTNDPYHGEYVLTIRSRGVGAVTLVPSRIDLASQIVPPQGIERELSLTVRPGKTLTAVRFAIDCPWISIEPTSPFGEERVDFRFRLKGLPEPMRLRETIHVYVTTLERGRTATFVLTTPLQVVGSASPAAWATPSVVHLGAAKSGSLPVRRLTLQAGTSWTKTPEVTMQGLEGFEVRAVAGTENTWELVPANGLDTGRIVGSVRFDFGPNRRISIPVHGWVGS